MSADRTNDGGPAFPIPAVYDHGRSEVNSSAAYTAEGGMTLRDYFIAHAPAEPQSWFQPVMQQPCPEKPVMPQVGEQRDRDYVREFDLVMDPDEADHPELRAYVVAIQSYQPVAAAWRKEAEKQRYVQWPAAWADAMLKARGGAS